MDIEKLKRIAELSKQIEQLPKGYISEKVIKGRVYYYRQWSEGGKTKSVYVNESDLPSLLEGMEKRKKLKEELNDLKWRGAKLTPSQDEYGFVLMHLDEPVVSIDFDESGDIATVGKVYDSALLPLSTLTSYGRVDSSKLAYWWRNRSIPSTRSEIEAALEKAGVSSSLANSLGGTKSRNLAGEVIWNSPFGVW